MATSEENLDTKKLDEYKKETTVHGQFLLVWNVIDDYLQTNLPRLNLKEYLITFSDSGDTYTVYFTKPKKKPILGGGSGKCIVDKKELKIKEFKLAK